MKYQRQLKNGIMRHYCPLCGDKMYDDKITSTCINYGLIGTTTETVKRWTHTELVTVRGAGKTTICKQCADKIPPNRYGFKYINLTEFKK